MSILTISRPTWRALRTELLRSVAPVAAVATLAAGAALVYSEANSWAGQWMPFAASVRFSMAVLAPLAVALGAWQGGRERRRQIGEQLVTAPRPGWQPMVVAWLSVTLGCWLALAIVVAAGAALVAPVATYTGGGWWWVLAVAFLALAAIVAVGVALGRAVPSRLTAPVLAVVLFSAQIYAHDDAGRLGGAEWLAPILPVQEAFGTSLPSSVSVWQALWFAGLAATALVLVGACRRLLALIPAALAAAGAAPFLTTPDAVATADDWRRAIEHWELDPDAVELVCTEDEPKVCLARHEAFLLDDVTPIAREALARLEGIPGAPTRAVGSTYGEDVGDEPSLHIDTGRTTITGDLYTGEDWRIVSWWPEFDCASTDATGEVRNPVDMWLIEALGTWVGGFPAEWTEPRAREVVRALEAMPKPERKAWIGEFIAAGEACDSESVDALQEQLS